MRITSIQNRLLAGIVFFMVSVLCVGGGALYLSIRSEYFRQVDNDLRKVAELLATEIEVSDGVLVNEWLEDVDDDLIRRKRDYIQSWNTDTGVTHRSPALGGRDLPRISGGLGEYVYRDVSLPGGLRGRAVGVKVLPKVEGHGAEAGGGRETTPHILVIANNVEDVNAGLARLRWILALTVIGVILASAVVSRNIIRSCLLPIDELSREVAECGTGELDKQFLPAPNFPEELKGLVAEYNKLFSKVGKVRMREREFSAHAAHELRTPIAGIIMTNELALNRERAADYYRECIAETLEIGRTMQKLTEGLLYFSKLQNDSINSDMHPQPLEPLLRDVWKQHAGAADGRGLVMRWECGKSGAVATVDEPLARILVANLFDNAVSYAEPGTVVTAGISGGAGEPVVFTLRNVTGTMTAAGVSRIFEPFYRMDKARIADSRHSGIGLALCREIARAMHCRIAAEYDAADREFGVRVSFN